MAYPTYNPEWATSNTYIDGTTPNKIRPDEGKRQYGYEPITPLSAQELNWQFNNLYEQIVELKTQLSTPSQTPINELKFIADDNGVQRSFSGGSTGGEYVHTQTVAEMPSHAHSMVLQFQGNNKASEGTAYAANREIQQGDIEGSDTRSTEATGGGQAMNVMQPFITVFIWKRVS